MDKKKIADILIETQRHVQALQSVVDLLSEENEELVEKTKTWDLVSSTSKLCTMAEAAKYLDMGFGRNTLLAYLRDGGILRQDNEPYQQYTKYFKLKEVLKNDQIYKTPFVNQKGLDFLRKFLVKYLESK